MTMEIYNKLGSFRKNTLLNKVINKGKLIKRVWNEELGRVNRLISYDGDIYQIDNTLGVLNIQRKEEK
jgi:hypothetical protein